MEGGRQREMEGGRERGKVERGREQRERERDREEEKEKEQSCLRVNIEKTLLLNIFM